MNFETAKAMEGRVVDARFPLLRWIGGSGQSAVFLTEMGPAKAVIKLVPADTLDANLQLLRWEQAAQLSHPHLMRLLTQGRCDIDHTRLLYVVAEYAEENLSEIVSQRPLTPDETRDVLLSMVEALMYLHRHGLVHGSVRPSNILAQGDHIKLSVDRITSAGQHGGRAGNQSIYDAPELASTPLSPAADLWSLGATLVTALTQRPPSNGRSDRDKDPRITDAIPQPFRTIARDCLRYDPAQRCELEEIKARLNATPLTAAPIAEHKRPPALLLIALLALLVLVGIFVGPKLLSRREPSLPENVKIERPPQAEPGQPAVSAVPPAKSPQASLPSSSGSKRPASLGAVERRVLPTVPQSARKTIHGKVRVSVRVDVDTSGKVTSATLVSPGPSKYFAKLAMKAAQQWQFVARKENGQPAPSRWLLEFQFGRTGTQVLPTQERR